MLRAIPILLLFYSLILGQENLLQPFPKVISNVNGSVLLIPQVNVKSISNDSIENKAVQYFNHLLSDKIKLDSKKSSENKNEIIEALA